jgi:hypothetical protein
MSHHPSLLLRTEVMDALRRGTVPRRGIDQFAVGTDRFEQVLQSELQAVAAGSAHFKALRGDYGCGKSFTARWFQQQALDAGFAVAEVQVSENDTPLHRLETVYRRAMEGLRTKEWDQGAFRNLIHTWLGALEDEVIEAGVDEDDDHAIAAAVDRLLEGRLAEVSDINPQFAAVLRACHKAQLAEDYATAEGLMAWLMAQPNVGHKVKREAGLKGDVDHTASLAFLRGMLTILKQMGRPGLMLVLDEVETIQRVRSDSRDRSLEALRKLIDSIYSSEFPGLYVLITGTPSFFDGPQGVRRLQPLAQRLHVDWGDPRFDNLRDVQIRLFPFSIDRLVEVGRKVRDLYPATAPERVAAKVTDEVIEGLAKGVAGELGGKVGVAPRIFLKKLVLNILDKVNDFDDFDPVKDTKFVIDPHTELTPEERAAMDGTATPDHIELDL